MAQRGSASAFALRPTYVLLPLENYDMTLPHGRSVLPLLHCKGYGLSESALWKVLRYSSPQLLAGGANTPYNTGAAIVFLKSYGWSDDGIAERVLLCYPEVLAATQEELQAGAGGSAERGSAVGGWGGGWGIGAKQKAGGRRRGGARRRARRGRGREETGVGDGLLLLRWRAAGG